MSLRPGASSSSLIRMLSSSDKTDSAPSPSPSSCPAPMDSTVVMGCAVYRFSSSDRIRSFREKGFSEPLTATKPMNSTSAMAMANTGLRQRRHSFITGFISWARSSLIVFFTTDSNPGVAGPKAFRKSSAFFILQTLPLCRCSSAVCVPGSAWISRYPAESAGWTRFARHRSLQGNKAESESFPFHPAGAGIP